MTTRVYQSAIGTLIQLTPPNSTPRVYQSAIGMLVVRTEIRSSINTQPPNQCSRSELPRKAVLS